MHPRNWDDVPAETLFQSIEWRRINDVVLREISHVLVFQAPDPYAVTISIECHPSRMVHWARQIENFRLN